MEKNEVDALIADDLQEDDWKEIQEFNASVLDYEEAISKLIEEWVQLSNNYDDYLNPRLRKKLVERFGSDEQDLECEALEFFQNELSALKRAIDEASLKSDWLSVIDICDSLVIFFNLRTYWEDLEETLKIALSASQKAENDLAEARVLNNLGHTFRLLGRAEEGISYCQKSVEIFREIKDERGIAEALYTLGYLFRSVGQWQSSISNFEECLSLFESFEDSVGKAGALDGLGQVYTKQGNLSQAEKVLRESLDIKEGLGNRFQVSITCNNLGKVYIRKGDLGEAENLFRRSLAIKQEINDRQGQGVSLNELGEVCRLKGEFDRAMNYYYESLKIKDQVSASTNSTVSDNHGKGLTHMNIGLLFKEKGDIEQAIDNWEIALDELNNYLPEFKQVQKWLQQFSSVNDRS